MFGINVLTNEAALQITDLGAVRRSIDESVVALLILVFCVGPLLTARNFQVTMLVGRLRIQ